MDKPESTPLVLQNDSSVPASETAKKQNTIILAVAIVINLLLCVQANFAGLFRAHYLGYFFLGVIFLVLFGLLIWSDRIALFPIHSCKLGSAAGNEERIKIQ